MWKREVQHTCDTLDNKTKIATTIYTGTKKKMLEGKKKTRKVQSTDKSQCKKYEGSQAQKKHDYTTPTTWEEKNKLILVNHHVPQTPPHVYQINLVILLSRQPHTTEIKKKRRQQNLETLSVKQHSLAGHLIEAKQKKKHTKGENTSAKCCLLQAFRFFSSVSLGVLNSTRTHTTPPLWLCQTRHWKRNKTFMTPSELHTSRRFLSLFSGRSQDVLLEQNEKKKRKKDTDGNYDLL